MNGVDIVTELRQWGANGYMIRAADEIERLRNELDGARLAYRGASYDRDRMRAERDAARREVCEARAACIQGKKATEIAAALGWSCFDKEWEP